MKYFIKEATPEELTGFEGCAILTPLAGEATTVNVAYYIEGLLRFQENITLQATEERALLAISKEIEKLPNPRTLVYNEEQDKYFDPPTGTWYD